MAKANPIDDARNLIEQRLGRIGEERERLERALAELSGSARRRRGPAAKKAPAARPPSSKKPKRRRGGTRRAKQVLDEVAKQPGITAGDIAKKLKVKPNYLYKVIGDLGKEGKIRKDGRQLFPKG